MDDSSKNKSTNPNLHLHDTLKNINDALDQWDKITNKPLEEQEDSRESSASTLKSTNHELFIKLKNQLADLSEEADKIEETLNDSLTENQAHEQL